GSPVHLSKPARRARGAGEPPGAGPTPRPRPPAARTIFAPGPGGGRMEPFRDAAVARAGRRDSPMADLAYGRDVLSRAQDAGRLEWIVTNGLGGFASGTASGALTRRY